MSVARPAIGSERRGSRGPACGGGFGRLLRRWEWQQDTGKDLLDWPIEETNQPRLERRKGRVGLIGVAPLLQADQVGKEQGRAVVRTILGSNLCGQCRADESLPASSRPLL
jgi:hypothetical protein